MAVLVVLGAVLFLVGTRAAIRLSGRGTWPWWLLILPGVLGLGVWWWVTLSVPAAWRGWTGPLWVLAEPRVSGVWHMAVSVSAFLMIVWLAVRALATADTASKRPRLIWLSAITFKPTEGDMASFMRQLSSVFRQVRGWLDRDASHIRFGLRGMGNGGVRLSAEVSEALLPRFEQANRAAYFDTQLHPDAPNQPAIRPGVAADPPSVLPDLPALGGGEGDA